MTKFAVVSSGCGQPPWNMRDEVLVSPPLGASGTRISGPMEAMAFPGVSEGDEDWCDRAFACILSRLTFVHHRMVRTVFGVSANQEGWLGNPWNQLKSSLQ